MGDQKWTERPPVGARVTMPGGFRGTVIETPNPGLEKTTRKHPDRVWVSWDGAAFSQLLDWPELGVEEPDDDEATKGDAT